LGGVATVDRKELDNLTSEQEGAHGQGSSRPRV